MPLRDHLQLKSTSLLERLMKNLGVRKIREPTIRYAVLMNEKTVDSL